MARLALAALVLTLLVVVNCESISEKRGICIWEGDVLCGDLEVLKPLNWWYDWHINPFYYNDNFNIDCPGVDFSSYDVNFAPMAWMGIYQHWDFPAEATVMLGYNEPNHHGQAYMQPEEAAENWPALVDLAGDLPLASPAAAPCGWGDWRCLGSTTEWFDAFYGNCTEMYGEAGCRVDYTATHWYGCNVDWLIGFLKNLYNRYGKPIWLTEFACPNEPDPDAIMDFMALSLRKLENKPWVAKYAWFMHRFQPDSEWILSSNSLFMPDSSELTPLGQFYLSYNHTAGK